MSTPEPKCFRCFGAGMFRIEGKRQRFRGEEWAWDCLKVLQGKGCLDKQIQGLGFR